MKAIASITLLGVLSGCASTTLRSDGSPLEGPICSATDKSNSVSVLWGAKWRPDQKEPPLRETAALRGIKTFFEAQKCPQGIAIHRIAIPDGHQSLSDADIVAMSTDQGDSADRVVVLIVRELGPKLIIGIPNLVEGGTEVVLESRVVDRQAVATIANLKTHWQKGGPFYIKGVKSLDLDMQTTLNAVFSSRAIDQSK